MSDSDLYIVLVICFLFIKLLLAVMLQCISYDRKKNIQPSTVFFLSLHFPSRETS